MFDASARCHSGVSLNDCLMIGPKLQQDIVNVLTGFRVHKVAFTTDICKMYRQIDIVPAHRKFQHILWREAPHAPVEEFTLNSITYGVNCAPYLALRVLRFIAENDCGDLPGVSRALRHQTYMDDICVGAESVAEAKSLQQSMVNILSRSGLELKKWASNAPEVLSHLKPEDCTTDPLNFDRGDGVQVLGMRWDPVQDCFSYDTPCIRLVCTKKGILSMIARIFDPLGLLAPTTFYAKALMQRLWLEKIGWDDSLPAEIKEEWYQFYSSLGWLSNIKIPRFMGTTSRGSYILCGFCDASEKGYAALVYLRATDSSQLVTMCLLGAKTKLAPMKDITISRLELSGAVLLAHWLAQLKATLEVHLTITDVYAWSDSTVVLSWLKNPHTSFKPFVSNRIHKIETVLPACHWSHVRSEDNPADCASRGLMPSELARYDLYWKGPDFLRQPVTDWSVGSTILEVDFQKCEQFCSWNDRKP